MLDTSGWPIATLDVLKDVRLDPKNVRLEVADAKVEADIMEDLFVNEGALSLVEGICKVGYLTHETPVVLERHGEYVMVEGNRRLAALKAIQNPMLVSDYQARVAAFAALLPDRAALSTVRVMIAPSQDEADQLIAAIHTGNLRRPWTPSRQAAFFQAQIASGREYADLLVRYPTIDVRKFVLRAHVVNLFKSVDFEDPALKDFMTTKKWARGLSTLARIYESKQFIDLTGIAMDDDGHLTISISEKTFARIAAVIVKGMEAGDINTRHLNSIDSPAYRQLIRELQLIKDEEEGVNPTPHPPTVSSPEDPTSTPEGVDGSKSEGDASPAGPSKEPAEPPKPSKPTSGKKQRKLDMGQVKAPDSYPVATKRLLGELAGLDVQLYSNATFLTMRAALEKSIKSFAEAKELDIKGSGNNDKGRVQLGQSLTWLLDYVKTNGPKYLVQCVESVRTGRLNNFASTKDALDATNHNHHYGVDADQALAMWASIDSIMRFLMKP